MGAPTDIDTANAVDRWRMLSACGGARLGCRAGERDERMPPTL
jgi:hypothetical protein